MVDRFLGLVVLIIQVLGVLQFKNVWMGVSNCCNGIFLNGIYFLCEVYYRNEVVLSSEIWSFDILWYYFIYVENIYEIYVDYFLIKIIDLNLYLDEIKCNNYVNQLI